MFSLQKLLGKEDKFFTLLEASAEEVCTSVQALVLLSSTLGRDLAQEEFARARRKDAEITQEISAAVFSGKYEPLQVVALKDLYELLEKVIDRCRDAGNVIAHIALKNS